MSLKDFKLKVTLPEELTKQDDLELILSNAIIESNIPEGSGLGSSAALSVSIARCFTTESTRILKLAKTFEDKFHFGSSGIDVFTSANGGLCRLYSNVNFEKLPTDLLRKLQKFKFSLVDTNERRKVSEIKSKINKNDLKHFLPAAAEISKEFEHFLFNETPSIDVIVNLFNRSHGALVQLKVSTPLIDLITSRLTNEFKNLGVKITGAGGGGCLLLVHTEEVTQLQLCNTLKDLKTRLYYDIQFLE